MNARQMALVVGLTLVAVFGFRILDKKTNLATNNKTIVDTNSSTTVTATSITTTNGNKTVVVPITPTKNSGSQIANNANTNNANTNNANTNTASSSTNANEQTVMAKNISTRCDSKTPESEKMTCFATGLEDIIKATDARRALKVLATLNDSDDFARIRCHTLSHAVGHAAYKNYGGVESAMKYTDSICWSGYDHGVMEAYMGQFDDKTLLKEMPKICKTDPKNPYTFDYYNCLHGLGHGLTIRFEQDIFKALPYCEKLPGVWERQSCYSGSFMQNIVTDQELHIGKDLKPEDPIYPCNVVNDEMKASCFLIQTSYVLRVLKYDYAKGFAVCDEVDKNFIATCYQSMGRDISGNFLLDVPKVVQHCALGKPEFQNYCIIGASKNAVFNDRATPRADALCNAVADNLKTACRAARDEAASTI